MPVPPSDNPSPRRAQLASFEHAYAVAVQCRRHGGRRQFIVRTGNPLQPYQISADTPAGEEQAIALVA